MRATIAVIEDEERIAGAVAARLRAEGFAVEVAGTGPDGVALCRRVAPDLVVLDWMLPGYDGIEVCRRIQADGSAPGVRIVLITGTPDPVLSNQAAAAGAVALLGKETPPGTIASQLLAAAEGRVGWSVE